MHELRWCKTGSQPLDRCIEAVCRQPGPACSWMIVVQCVNMNPNGEDRDTSFACVCFVLSASLVAWSRTTCLAATRLNRTWIYRHPRSGRSATGISLPDSALGLACCKEGRGAIPGLAFDVTDKSSEVHSNHLVMTAKHPEPHKRTGCNHRSRSQILARPGPHTSIKLSRPQAPKLQCPNC